MSYIENSEKLVGYKVRIMDKDVFVIIGFTHTYPAKPNDGEILER